MKVNPQALRAIREKDGHSTHSFAKASGVSQQRIWQLENAEEPVEIRPTTAKRLADALRVPLSAITVSDEVEVAG